MKIKENIIKLKGRKINYATTGKGAPMVFLSNGGGFWQIWYFQIKYFAKKYKVYALDWPGCGESEATDESLSLDFLYDIFRDFISELKLKNITVISTCVGGAVAMKYTIEKPENIVNLVVINLCPGDRIFPFELVKLVIRRMNPGKKTKSLFAFLLRILVTKTPLKRNFPRILFGDDYDKSSFLFNKYLEKLNEKKQALIRVDLIIFANTYNLVNYLKDETTPKHLLIWGNQNRVAPLKKQGYYHYNLLRSTEFVIIKNAGHMCMYEAPVEVNSIIDNYLKNNSI